MRATSSCHDEDEGVWLTKVVLALFWFRSINGKTYAPVNLDRIAHWIEQGRLTSSPEKPITAKELVLSGCIHNAHDGVKLLGDVRRLPAFCIFFTRLLMRCWILQGAEHLKVPIHITPSRASKSAIRAVEKQGGTVMCRYYNRLSLYDCVKGRADRIDAAPTRRQDIRMYILFRTSIGCTEMIFSKEWYTNWKNRGYLAPESIAKMPIVQERWRQLSEQLTRFRSEEFVKR